MSQERILIVEDEGIVAADLESMLTELGYRIVGKAATGQDAIDQALQTTPDLVLMDIRLRGVMDGIEAAEQIHAQLGVPVTYLTAYADEDTLGRAKTTMPYGYILKPFEEKDLRTAIELALYKHRMESMLTALEGWHATALRSLPDAVVAVDKNMRISFLNQEAEHRFGWALQDVFGKPFGECLSPDVSFQDTLERHMAIRSEAPIVITLKNGQHMKVNYSVSPIQDSQGHITGALLVLYPSDRERAASTVVASRR